MDHGGDLTAIALVMFVALLFGLGLTRIKQPPLIGYILTGVVLGPTGLGIIENSEPVRFLAELGVILLLFLIGMELSLKAFTLALRTAVLTMLLQVAISLGVTLAVGQMLGWTIVHSVVFGFMIALSSTAVAVKLLEAINELRTHIGRITVGVLIAQDIAVVPMLLLVQGMGGDSGLDYAIVVQIGVGIAVLGLLIWFFSRRDLVQLPFGRMIDRRAELRPLAALAACFLLATASGAIGLSTAYGAFIAGLIIGNSTLRRPMIQATEPIQTVLITVFFLSIGLLIDLDYIRENWVTVAFFLLMATIIKTAANILILQLLRVRWQTAFPAGVLLGQIGEFSFVLAAAGMAAGAIDDEAYRLALAVIALSLLISPLWQASLRRFHDIMQAGIADMNEVMAEVFREEVTTYRRARLMVRKLRRARRRRQRRRLEMPVERAADQLESHRLDDR